MLKTIAKWFRRHFGPIDPHKDARRIIRAMCDKSDADYAHAIAAGTASDLGRVVLAARCLALSDACLALWEES